ncbi:MAG: FAD-dependent oxidoreductase [bacterium]|nr:FAD-dependent oxidoreductase [bacterium]
MLDLAIIGSGPAGLSAAIYAARDGHKVQVFEKTAFGGLVASSEFIENYPGFEDGISGLELSKKMRAQAEKFGAKIVYGEVSNIEESENAVKFTADGQNFEAKTMLLAVGNSYRKLDLPREDEFYGRGIHSCATCDGPIYAGQTIIAVGGGNSAVTEALFLSKFSKVKLLVRSEIRAEKVLQERLKKAIQEGKIEIFLGAEVEEFLFEEQGNFEKIRGARINQKRENGQIETFDIEAAAIFEFIGLTPNTDFLKDSPVKLNDFGEIAVDSHLKTSGSRIWAAGDAIENATKQIAVASGNGVRAALEISKFIENLAEI